MRDAVLPVDPVKGGHFIDSDRGFEVIVPPAAVSGADIAGAGGRVALSLRQIAPASGSSAGGSGHVSLGTYLIQVVDAAGRLVGHGLRKPVTVTFHYAPHERALGLANGFVLVNGSPPTGANFNPDPTGAAMTASAAGVGAPTPVPIVRGDNSGSATIALSSPSAMASYNSNSPVATFGKPDPFNVDLNAGSLTAGVPLDARQYLALPAGNTAEKVVTIRVPAGTIIYDGQAAGVRGMVGGGNQIYIPQVDPAWVG